MELPQANHGCAESQPSAQVSGVLACLADTLAILLICPPARNNCRQAGTDEPGAGGGKIEHTGQVEAAG